MQITFLGTGTSHGVPMIGCHCAVCTSTDARDRRFRASLLVTQDDGTVVLVDTGADLRMQALTFGVERVDAVVYTHSHADHIFGLDELRRFNVLRGADIPLYADARTLVDLQRIFPYAFWSPPEWGGGVPRLTAHRIEGPFQVGSQVWQPVPIVHGKRPILGFRIGALAYLTDCSHVPEASWPLLEGLDVLVLDALRHKPHPTHLSVAEAVDVARRIGARRTLFTHMGHELPHAATCEALPTGMALAYDGLSVVVPAASAA